MRFDMKLSTIRLVGTMMILAIMLMSSCSTPNSTGNTVKQTKTEKIEPIRIAWIGPLTGAVASLGIDNLNGIKLAVEEKRLFLLL